MGKKKRDHYSVHTKLQTPQANDTHPQKRLKEHGKSMNLYQKNSAVPNSKQYQFSKLPNIKKKLRLIHPKDKTKTCPKQLIQARIDQRKLSDKSIKLTLQKRSSRDSELPTANHSNYSPKKKVDIIEEHHLLANIFSSRRESDKLTSKQKQSYYMKTPLLDGNS